MPLADLMNATATVERPSSASGPSMTRVETWNTVAQDAPCRIAPHDARKFDRFDQKVGQVTHRAHFYPPVDLKYQDRVTVTGGNSSVGEVYEVEEVFIPDHVNLFQVAYVKRISSS